MRMASENGVKSLWGVPIRHLFSLATEFYRKEKDSIQLEYGQKIQLLALYKQEKLGPHTAEKDGETGYFDVVGADRRKAWIKLGDIKKDEAQRRLVVLLHSVAPNLKEYVLEQWTKRRLEVENEEKIKKAKEMQNENNQLDGQASSDSTRRDPLTAVPFQSTPSKTKVEMKSVFAPAALWCSPKAARQFILESSTSSQHQLTINPGETVTVQVPTSPNATAIFWEFVTTSGDIGFGLSFQRSSDDPNLTFPIEPLLPVVKRDCSEDLVLGNHQYQLSGTYFLYFDNGHCPYSSKVVFYKVFYQKST